MEFVYKFKELRKTNIHFESFNKTFLISEIFSKKFLEIIFLKFNCSRIGCSVLRL